MRQYEIDLAAFAAAETAGRLPIEVLAFRQREAARTYGADGWSYAQLIPPPPPPGRYDTLDGLPGRVATRRG
jgi:hypothetical protein